MSVQNPSFNNGILTSRGMFPGGALLGAGLATGMGLARSVVQGACSGAMTLVGLLTALGSELDILPMVPLEELAHQYLSAIMTANILPPPLDKLELLGPVEVLIGIALFITAGRGIGRVFGVLGFLFYASAVISGYDFSNLMSLAENIWSSLQTGVSSGLDAFDDLQMM